MVRGDTMHICMPGLLTTPNFSAPRRSFTGGVSSVAKPWKQTLRNGTTSYNNATGQIKPLFASDPANITIDNQQSRWRIQVGAKLLF